MPNGKPGDHPYTDIIVHGADSFGTEITALVKEIHALPGFDAYRNEVQNLLAEHDPTWNKESSNLELVQAKLLAIRMKLKTSAD
jgi:hypothetical protein